MEYLWQILVIIVTAIVASLVSVKLTLGKFRSERLWDQRLEVYNNILHILYEFRSIYAAWGSDNVEVVEKIKLIEKLNETAQEWDSSLHRYQFVLPIKSFNYLSDFGFKLEKLIEEIASINEDKGLEYFNKVKEIIDNDVTYIIAIAKGDLKID